MELPINSIITGDNMEVMAGLPDNCIDTILTDPPYGLGFMGKDWDTFKPGYRADNWAGYDNQPKTTACMHAGKYDHSRNVEFQQWFTLWAKEVLRIAKPGAMMLIFGGTRTYHRLACAIEDAGWEIRDCMMYLYGSGFPKSLDISKAIDKAKGAEREVVGDNPNNRPNCVGKQMNTMSAPITVQPITASATDLAKLWDGHGTALKPAWEPIIVAMKPIEGTFAQNAEKWGVAGLNIDGGRIGAEIIPMQKSGKTSLMGGLSGKSEQGGFISPEHQGRWPANVLLDEQAAAMLDEQSGITKSTGGLTKGVGAGDGRVYSIPGKRLGANAGGLGDIGGASRFFYCAKASRSERNAGLEGMEAKQLESDFGSGDICRKRSERIHPKMQNNHPTVKPLKLMEYLCKLTKQPGDGVVLDPFGGSGTTALACINTGRKYILIEKDPQYCEIAKARIKGQGALFD